LYLDVISAMHIFFLFSSLTFACAVVPVGRLVTFPPPLSTVDEDKLPGNSSVITGIAVVDNGSISLLIAIPSVSVSRLISVWMVIAIGILPIGGGVCIVGKAENGYETTPSFFFFSIALLRVLRVALVSPWSCKKWSHFPMRPCGILFFFDLFCASIIPKLQNHVPLLFFSSLFVSSGSTLIVCWKTTLHCVI